MAQPVTAFSPPMLASKLDELSELASRFVNVSDELRMMLHSHLADGESSWKPSNAALSNTTQDRPSLLQPTSQATIPPSYVVSASRVVPSLIVFAALLHSFYNPVRFRPAPPPLFPTLPVRFLPTYNL